MNTRIAPVCFATTLPNGDIFHTGDFTCILNRIEIDLRVELGDTF